MNLDLRQYGRLQMYMHAEGVNSSNDIQNNELYGVVRFGNDLINNYYEIRIPLDITPWGTSDPILIWPEKNKLDLALEKLIQLKVQRNNSGPVTDYYQGHRS